MTEMDTEETYLIRTEKLAKAYKGRKVVREVEINVKAGEIVGLLGPNGAGKTTSFYMIVGLVRPSGGKVYLSGRDVTSVPMFKRARMGMGYLSQEPSIFRKLTVQDNVMAILETLPISGKERKRRLNELLEELKIAHLAKQRAYTLSGGERRRLEITRALVTDPSIILLDEPFAGVDPLAVNDVQDIVKKLKEKGLGVLITDHSVRDTLAVVDRAYLLCEGQVLREGNSDFLVNDEVSRELYLGPRFSM
ncbi:MAG: LPS export ABC transporter ATP-binding protein [Pontiellaceae bacterium]|nr:LPS export ABC transporter ATP-binding protein [Pontiellaceae bacterium]MBN2783826.1 LPS export ABC transporter ATP-binding protein [Pontiellaceae bacterium]